LQKNAIVLSSKMSVETVVVTGALKTLTTDSFLVSVVQVTDDYVNRFDKLHELWVSVPRDWTRYDERK